MPGNNPSHLVILQPRDRELLLHLDVLRVIDREQARVIGPFGSVTRANTRLLQLATAGLLTRQAVGTTSGGHKYLYARTRQGAVTVQHTYRPPPWNAQSPIIAGQPLLEHQLRLNELYLALQYPLQTPANIQLRTWQPLVHPPVPSMPQLIPDVYVELERADGIRPFFVEMDLATEPTRTWTRKTHRFLALARSGDFHRTYGRPHFGVLVVAPSARRLESLRQTIVKHTSKLFWLTTFESLHRNRIWTAVWQRPIGHDYVSLFP